MTKPYSFDENCNHDWQFLGKRRCFPQIIKFEGTYICPKCKGWKVEVIK